jgi:hypothetical protein
MAILFKGGQYDHQAHPHPFLSGSDTRSSKVPGHSEVIELIGPTNWAGLKKLEGRIPDEDLLSEACWAAKRNALNAA